MKLALSAAACSLALAGCNAEDVVEPVPIEPQTVHARLTGVDGTDHGTVELSTSKSGRALLRVQVQDIPMGSHGFHIHETGVCDPAGEFESAGGHLSGGAAHGLRSDDGKHIGDLPNLFVPASGRLRVEFFLDDVAIENGPAPLLDMDGAAFVIHAVADDYQTQPSGNAGARIACGVIERKPEFEVG